MRLPLSIVCASLLTSCTTLDSTSGTNDYSKLEGQVGEEIMLVGYWSNRHEATGIYFGRRNYHGDAPKQCVETYPTLTAAHGSAVRVKGLLVKSGCGDKDICLSVCQPYILKNAQIVK